MAALTQAGGHSLLPLRAIPALFAGGAVYVTCLLMTEFGGGAFAQLLAALVVFCTPVLASFGTPRLWLVLGFVAGVCFESKYSVAFVLAALCVGLAATAQRRVLYDRWFVAASALAVAIVLPNSVWQAQHGLPMLELLRNDQTGKNTTPGPLLYVAQQLIITNPLLAPVWLGGLVWLLRPRRCGSWRTRTSC